MSERQTSYIRLKIRSVWANRIICSIKEEHMSASGSTRGSEGLHFCHSLIFTLRTNGKYVLRDKSTKNGDFTLFSGQDGFVQGGKSFVKSTYDTRKFFGMFTVRPDWKGSDFVGECPICFEFSLLGSVKPCSHRLCQTCSDKINECPYCRSKLSMKKSYRI